MKIRIALAILLLLGVTGIAAAYPNNYTLYVTTTTSDGNALNITFHITGNMLPPVPPMGGVLHTPYAIFALGTTRYNYQWQGVCTTCDMNDYSYPTANYQLSCGDVDTPCIATEEMMISCQILGTYFVNGGPSSGYYGLIFQRAISIAQNTGQQIGDFGWVLTNQCTSATSPPDFDPKALINANLQPPAPAYAPYYKARAICSRAGNAPAGSAWSCQPVFQYLLLSVANAFSEFASYGDGFNYNCTNRDKGYTGKPWP